MWVEGLWPCCASTHIDEQNAPRRPVGARPHRHSPWMMMVLPSWLAWRQGWRRRGPPLSCGDEVMKRQWVRVVSRFLTALLFELWASEVS